MSDDAAIAELDGELLPIAVDAEPRAIAELVQRLTQAGRPLTDLTSKMAREQSKVVAACALLLAPDVADRLLDAAWQHLEPRAALAAAARVARSLPSERALVWSARLRAQALAEFCPLVASARDEDVLPSARVRSGSIAWRAFADPEARAAFLLAASCLDGVEVIQSLRSEVALLAPDILTEFDAATGRAEPKAWRRRAAGASGRGASIVVLPPQGHLAARDRFAAIEEVTPSTEYEVILLETGGSSAVPEALDLCGSARQVVTVEDDGQVVAMGRAAALATGEYLVFLGGDVQPSRGWLDEIYRAFDGGGDAGAVVPTVRQGSLDLAHVGVEILLDCRYEPTFVLAPRRVRDGERGRGSDSPVELQAGSGEAIAIRRTLFEEIGGFDRDYAEPYATVDLCLRLGMLGWRVIHEPSSVVRRRAASLPRGAAGRLELPVERACGAAAFDERWIDAAGPDRMIGVRELARPTRRAATL